MKICRICGREESENDLTEKGICSQCNLGDSLADNILRNPQMIQLREDLQKLANLPFPGGGFSSGNPGAEDNFRKLGEIVHLAFRAEKGNMDALEKLQSMGVQKASMQEDTLSEGGYLVPTGHEGELLRIPDRGYTEPLLRRIPMQEKTRNIPDLESTVTVAWKAEEDTLTAGEPTIGQVQLTAQKLTGLVTISNELLMDSRPDAVQIVGEIMAEAMAQELDNQVFNGTGSPCSGILSDKAGYSVIMTGLTAFSSISQDHLSDMIAKLKPMALPNARFVMHPDIVGYVRKLKDDQNKPIWADIGGAVGGQIWGYPVLISDQMPAASDSAANTPFVNFGNFRYFLLGTRTDLEMAIDPYGLFTTYQSRIRWVRRIAPKIGVANAFVRLLTAT